MTTRTIEVIRKTVERITFRYKTESQTAYCSTCGKPTTLLTAEQAEEIFGAVAAPIDGAHPTEAGSVMLLCAGSMISPDDGEE